MRCSTSILGMSTLVRLLQLLRYKAVARKRIVKTSGNRLRRLMWSDCKDKGKVFLVPAVGLREVESPHILRHSAHKWRQGCQPYVPATFYPHENSWYSFLLERESIPGP
jgi:hypothetical protein